MKFCHVHADLGLTDGSVAVQLVPPEQCSFCRALQIDQENSNAYFPRPGKEFVSTEVRRTNALEALVNEAHEICEYLRRMTEAIEGMSNVQLIGREIE